ncbi:MAG: 1-acyl-sn-glycerol-3-phosphate acyltransferase [Myxococcales bacterium]|nr:1-acyl-sn-glycerol-3-phosphate acyltransferase [Myxococcales bacterium]
MTRRFHPARLLARAVLTRAQRQHLEGLRLDDAGHGWDRFGASREGIAAGLVVTRHLYDFYFRVQSFGAHHVPARGAAILVSNHSGTLPLDGMMLWADVLLHTDPPRAPRPVADHFVPALPFINTLFSRAGMVPGSRANVRALLEAGELLELFPEGVAGIGKPPSEAYRLQRWTVGHAELAIRHGAPVVPAAVIGAEEQWPQLGRVERLHPFGIPYLPLPATPLPLPVRYRIHYGPPVVLADHYRPQDADDPAALREAAARTRAAVAQLIDHGLAQREAVFR